jgi:hypothetical protein
MGCGKMKAITYTKGNLKRIQSILETRVKDQMKISEAVEGIKQLRRKCKGWNSTDVIRRWREKQ